MPSNISIPLRKQCRIRFSLFFFLSSSFFVLTRYMSSLFYYYSSCCCSMSKKVVIAKTTRFLHSFHCAFLHFSSSSSSSSFHAYIHIVALTIEYNSLTKKNLEKNSRNEKKMEMMTKVRHSAETLLPDLWFDVPVTSADEFANFEIVQFTWSKFKIKVFDTIGFFVASFSNRTT